MKSRTLRWLGIGLLVLIAVIHLYMAPSEYEETALLGYLFAANFVGALIAAVGIRHRTAWGWVLGFWVAGGAIAGYIVTRTVGMPGMEPEEWLYPVGVLATLLELGFVVAFALARPWESGNPDTAAEGRGYGRLVLPAALGFVMAFGLSGLIWNAIAPDAHTEHTAAVAHATLISDSAFAEKYGVEVLRIAPSMMNSVVDFRLRILDKARAQALLSNHDLMPMLLVDGGTTVLTAPRQHMHQARLKDGGVYYALYPNPNQVVRTGTTVAVQFGNLRLAPTTAQ